MVKTGKNGDDAVINKMHFGLFEEFIRNQEDGSSAENVYPPELDDLYYLYSSVRDNSVCSVLELGGGWSTLAMAQGIYENRASFGEEHLARVRHPNPFQLLSIDASQEFSNIAALRLPEHLAPLVRSHVSSVSVAELGGSPSQICSLYDDFPTFSPDLVYLDGPDSDQVAGTVRGYGLVQPHSVPMGGDLISIEPQLWPGTLIVTDGRMANARFLLNNFRRNWESITDFHGNRVIMRLAEEAFGQVSLEHTQVRLEGSRKLRLKELPLESK